MWIDLRSKSYPPTCPFKYKHRTIYTYTLSSRKLRFLISIFLTLPQMAMCLTRLATLCQCYNAWLICTMFKELWKPACVRTNHTSLPSVIKWAASWEKRPSHMSSAVPSTTCIDPFSYSVDTLFHPHSPARSFANCFHKQYTSIKLKANSKASSLDAQVCLKLCSLHL